MSIGWCICVWYSGAHSVFAIVCILKKKPLRLPCTKRQRTKIKVLNSNPFKMLVCRIPSLRVAVIFVVLLLVLRFFSCAVFVTGSLKSVNQNVYTWRRLPCVYFIHELKEKNPKKIGKTAKAHISFLSRSFIRWRTLHTFSYIDFHDKNLLNEWICKCTVCNVIKDNFKASEEKKGVGEQWKIEKVEKIRCEREIQINNNTYEYLSLWLFVRFQSCCWNSFSRALHASACTRRKGEFKYPCSCKKLSFLCYLLIFFLQ